MSMQGKWGYSHDEETYHGSFDTWQEAAAEAVSTEGGRCWVGQYRDPVHPGDAVHFHADSVIETVWEHEDYSGEWAEGAIGTTKAMDDDLEKRLAAAFRDWVDVHQLRPKFGMVEECFEIKLMPNGKCHRIGTVDQLFRNPSHPSVT